MLEDFSWERRAASGGGWSLLSRSFFDTVQLRLPSEAEAAALQKAFWKRGINLGRPQPDILSWTLSELTEEEDLLEIKEILESASLAEARKRPRGRAGAQPSGIPPHLQRQSLFLAHPVFNSFHSETEPFEIHPPPSGQGAFAGPLNDSAGILHNEAQRRR